MSGRTSVILVQRGSQHVFPGIVILVAIVVSTFDWGRTWPKAWVPAVAPQITEGFKWVAREAAIGGVEVGELVRGAAKVIEWPMVLLQGLLVNGLTLPTWVLSDTVLPPLPWFVTLGAAASLAHWAGGWRLAALICGTAIYLLLFGLWESAMLTMALVMTSVAVGTVLGVGLGVAAWRSPAAERALTPIYDLLQVLPIFSYLLPVVVLFGFGPLSGLIATVIFAMPPMARVTTLALRKLPRSTLELAEINGCNLWQKIGLVYLPSARADLIVGLNQVVNLSFAVAVFAAVIGGGGLGNDLFAALKSLRLGPALEAGIAITLLAITLDRICRAAALRRSVHFEAAKPTFAQQYPRVTVTFGLLAFGLLFIAFDPALARFPTEYAITTNTWFNTLVSIINTAAGEDVGRLRDWLILSVLRPVKDTLQAIPWPLSVAAAACAAYYAAGPRLSLTVAALLGLVVIGGYWAPAMTSLYLALLGAVIATLLGFPLGVLGALSQRMAALNDILVDLIQTLPSFVYLVPVMMILGIGDVPALAAIALYAIAPAIRFTQSGLLQTGRSIMEAATMSGCSRLQTMLLVQLPIARRDLLLGLNQTLIMAFGMLVVTAMVGTRGLEANTLTALGKIDTGEGLLAGLALVALTIVCDRVIRAVATRATTTAV
jgi:glycine betaine/proline transport system permease protein